MLNSWIIATLTGACLGLALFACVRLRMHFGPILRDRYGQLARRAYWLLTIVGMVVLANLGLVLLRRNMGEAHEPMINLMLELWFAVLAFGIAFLLIVRQLRRDSCDPMKE